jgi:hypothetical protein
MTQLHDADRIGGALDGGFGEFRSMGVAGGFPGNGPEPESLGGVVGRGL